MANSLDHAKHNHTLCKNLRDGNIFYDWCVTTAFYSALHYVNLKILPCKISQDTITNIKEAQQKLNSPTLHDTRLKLVKLQCDTIAKQYRWLKDHAHNARYVTYKIPVGNADKAIDFLNKIAKYCTTK
ncbi:hypothetical protein D1632_15485 [Chryseobacterium nematophagum]|uniref:HEPN domain-containing protein n=1 Tax=Chryseobacterium nematophagum TaxID=2305228 RepID=A0A3M7LBX5_9FLAO|nr:hypothetical protein [Chryseobacterium nematophagum]RMZ58966.1 hypothetical protein D1632_15485 [Chryseobacterium nematophagum]